MRRRLEVNIFELRLLVWQKHIRAAAVSDHPTASMAEMPVEEGGDLAKRLLGFRHAIVELVLSLRLTLVDFELRVDAGLADQEAHRVLLSIRKWKWILLGAC